MDGNDEEASKKLKQIVYVTDAMTAKELDGDGRCFVSLRLPSRPSVRDLSLTRIRRFPSQIRHDKAGNPIGLTKRVWKIAQGSGTSVRDVEE